MRWVNRLPFNQMLSPPHKFPDMSAELPVSLAEVTCVGPGVESALLSLDLFERTTPLAAIHRAIRNPAEPVRHVPYLIWGGLAANLLLMAVGRTTIFYSLHDIELLDIVNGRISRYSKFLPNINIHLSDSKIVGLGIGGNSLPENCYKLTPREFQMQRVALSDGDLYLNNIAILVDSAVDQLEVFCPLNTLGMLLSSSGSLDVKPVTDLHGSERLARRITRSIAKATRFLRVAELPVSSNFYRVQGDLVMRFMFQIQSENGRESIGLLRDPSWFQVAGIENLNDAGRWLFERAFSETVKRLAGVEGISSDDRDGFMSFVRDAANPSTWALRFPLLQALAVQIASVTNIGLPTIDEELLVSCYDDFFRYQQHNAHLLVQELSQKP